MLHIVRRALSLLTLAPAAAAAQWLGPTRTWESDTQCASGTLSYTWVDGQSAPLSTFGVAYCGSVGLTLGQRASDGMWTLRAQFRLVSPTGLNIVGPVEGGGSYFEARGPRTIAWSPPVLTTPALGPGSPAVELQTFVAGDFLNVRQDLVGSIQIATGRLGTQWRIQNATRDGSSSSSCAVYGCLQYGTSEFTFAETTAQTVTPEPSTYALLGAGLLALAGVATRRRTT